uniref:CSON005969 protein n=1 Tax=Culicoides sonorensis TaxID=179676 RepID=A0A336MRP4_CULSO
MALNCSKTKGLCSSAENEVPPPICQHLSTLSSEDPMVSHQENSPNDGVRVITEELVNYYKNEEYPELQQIMQRINYHPDFELLFKLNHMVTQSAMKILLEDGIIDYMAKIVYKNSVFFPNLKHNVVKVNGNPIFDPVTQYILKSFAVQCNNKKEGYYFEKAQIPHDEFPESQEKRMKLMDWIKEKYRLNRTVRGVYSKYMKSQEMKNLEFDNFLKIDEDKKNIVASHNCAVCETKIKIYVIINKYYMIERYGTILLKNHLNMHKQRDGKIKKFHFDSEENAESDDSFDGYVEQPMTVQTKVISDSETESELTLEMIDSKPPQIPENCAISLPGLIRS